MCTLYEIGRDIAWYSLGGHIARFKVSRRGVMAPGRTATILIGGLPGDTGAYPATEASWGWPVPGRPRPVSLIRSEAADLPGIWHAAFRECRCLVPATTWIEFQQLPDQSKPTPWRLHRGGAPFFFAGLWRPHTPMSGEIAYEYCLLNREAEGHLAEIHPRMPVIIHHSQYDAWLGPDGDPGKILRGGAITRCWRGEKIVFDRPPAKPA